MFIFFVKYSWIILNVKVDGDIYIDVYYIVEDIGIIFGFCLKEVFVDKVSINCYGFVYVLMDELFGFCVLDLSGCFYLVFDVELINFKFGDFDIELVEEFF